MRVINRNFLVIIFFINNISFKYGIELGKDVVSFLENERSVTMVRTFYRNSTVTVKVEYCHQNVTLVLNSTVNKINCYPMNASTKTETEYTLRDYPFSFKCPHPDKLELPATSFPETGVYRLIFKFIGSTDTLSLDFKGDHGYLSPYDWPLLPFYAVMCVLYSVYAFVWMVFCCCYWKELLRLQFWIGGVILMGMLEKAMFLGEYDTFSKYGETTGGLLIAAEFISSLKKTVSRMLVIIVSLGFGIIRPRLGTALHQVTLVGLLFLIFNFAEALCSRVYVRSQSNTTTTVVLGLLVLMDSIIMLWIFTNLVKTIRLLTLRKNLIKLTLYRHFRNVIIFSILISLVYIAWSTVKHRFQECIVNWSEMWWDVAFWHLLFSIILLAIIILWRPAANNQRYAYSPLYDGEDGDELLENNNEGLGVKKLRRGDSDKAIKGEDDDLKWVEENIPSSAIDNALSNLIESEEEINQNKVEINKML